MLDTPAIEDHLDRLVRTSLGVPRTADIKIPRLPHRLARLAMRVEEYERNHRDRWGCWEFAFSNSFRTGRLWQPEVDHWLANERRRLADLSPLEPVWPDARAFAICLTHDVDLLSESSTVAQVVRSMRSARAVDPSSREDRLLRLARPAVRAVRAVRAGISTAPNAKMLDRCVGVEREYGVTGSYFFTVLPGSTMSRYDCSYDLDDPCRFRSERMRVKDVVSLLADEGHDVGLHGSYSSALTPGLLAREKDVLETALGRPVTTTRQHFLHWEVRTTPRLQADAGIRADATLGFNRNVGFRAGTSLPFRLFDLIRDEPLDVLEVPLVIHDGPLLRADGLELDLDLAREVVQVLMDEIEKTGGVATLLFHPNNLSRSEYVELFRWSIEYGLRRGAWFATLRDIDEWWREREARLLTR